MGETKRRRQEYNNATLESGWPLLKARRGTLCSNLFACRRRGAKAHHMFNFCADLFVIMRLEQIWPQTCLWSSYASGPFSSKFVLRMSANLLQSACYIWRRMSVFRCLSGVGCQSGCLLLYVVGAPRNVASRCLPSDIIRGRADGFAN